MSNSEDEEYREPVTAVESLAPGELADRLAADEPVTLLDVRNRDEVEEWAIDAPQFTNVPYMKWLSADVTDGVADLAADVEGREPVVVVCGRGEASAYVASLLVREGVEAVNLADGMRGWARVYERTALDTPGDEATVYQYRRPSSGCLAYLVVSAGEAAVVDPLRAFAGRYADDAAALGADLVYAVDTHVHADHVSGVREVRDATGAEVVLPGGARGRGLTFDATLVGNGDELRIGDTALEAVHAPGHTSEMTAFRVGRVLLTGDALFLRGVPRPDLEHGSGSDPDGASGEQREPRAAGTEGAEPLARDLYETLTGRFGVLPDVVTVAPGHYADETERGADGTYTATLGDLRGRLDAFAVDEETFVERILADAPPRPANFEEIVATNLGRETVDDEAAFELELGPNNCAAAPADD